MSLVTFVCAYVPCSKTVTYARTFPGAPRKYCCLAHRRKNEKRNNKGIEKLKQRAEEHRAQGLCVSCNVEVVPGRLHCYEHLRYFRQFQQERRKRLRSALRETA